MLTNTLQFITVYYYHYSHLLVYQIVLEIYENTNFITLLPALGMSNNYILIFLNLKKFYFSSLFVFSRAARGIWSFPG